MERPQWREDGDEGRWIIEEGPLGNRGEVLWNSCGWSVIDDHPAWCTAVKSDSRGGKAWIGKEKSIRFWSGNSLCVYMYRVHWFLDIHKCIGKINRFKALEFTRGYSRIRARLGYPIFKFQDSTRDFLLYAGDTYATDTYITLIENWKTFFPSSTEKRLFSSYTFSFL